MWIKLMKDACRCSKYKKFLKSSILPDMAAFFDVLDWKYEGICPEVLCTSSAVTNYVSYINSVTY